jgi:hypothetical protein
MDAGQRPNGLEPGVGDGSSEPLRRPAPITVTIPEFARQVKASVETVREGLENGRIPREADGRINPDIAIPMWNATRRVGRPPAANGHVGVQARANLNAAKAEKEYFQARIAELEYLKRSGELVDAKQVESAAFETGRKLRDRLKAMAVRTGTMLAGISDPKESVMMLERDIIIACEDDVEPEITIEGEEEA